MEKMTLRYIMIVSCFLLQIPVFAGTGTATGTSKIIFGQANSKLRECSGSGICQMGARAGGVDVSILYINSDNTDGSGVTSIILKFNYNNAIAYAKFIDPMQGPNPGVVYMLNAPDGQPTIINAPGSGIPLGTQIPPSWVAIYGPPDADGMASLVITLFQGATAPGGGDGGTNSKSGKG